MKNTFSHFILIFVLLIASSFAAPEKKVVKLVNKVWKDSNPILKEIETPDSLKTNIGHLSEIIIDENIAGYACYATAFGCKVGGCAAPSNPNIQSYETFDYIVIYDANFKVLKVDIAEYGGQYGYEICRAKWLRQFEGGRTGFKLGSNIDGITGATVSAQFLIDDLNTVGEELKTFLNTAACL